MVFQNTYSGFFYRQFFLTPAQVTLETRSMVGKTGIVTGSNTGLGYHASSQLLALGLSRLILAVRDPKKGEAARTSLLLDLHHQQSDVGKTVPTIEVWSVDLTDYTSMISFAERVRDTPGFTVDFCILNAGVCRFGYDVANQNEVTVQTNWLGTALLAITLRPILQAQYARGGGVVANGNGKADGYVSNASAPRPPVLSIVGSETAQWAAFKELKVAGKEKRSVLSVLNDKPRFSATDRYYTSKLLLALFLKEFTNRLPADNAVVVNMVNPGFCYGTELHRSLSGPLGMVFAGVKRAIGRPTAVGARTLVHAAVIAGPESHGCYLCDEKEAPFMDFPLTAEGQACGRQMWEEMADELGTSVDVNAVMKEG